jgi:hypothetical protein
MSLQLRNPFTNGGLDAGGGPWQKAPARRVRSIWHEFGPRMPAVWLSGRQRRSAGIRWGRRDRRVAG